MQSINNCPKCKRAFRGDECACGFIRKEKKIESRACMVFFGDYKCDRESFANIGITWKPERDFYICERCFYQEKEKQDAKA